MPGTVLGTGDRTVNRTQFILSKPMPGQSEHCCWKEYSNIDVVFAYYFSTSSLSSSLRVPYVPGGTEAPSLLLPEFLESWRELFFAGFQGSLWTLPWNSGSHRMSHQGLDFCWKKWRFLDTLKFVASEYLGIGAVIYHFNIFQKSFFGILKSGEKSTKEYSEETNLGSRSSVNVFSIYRSMKMFWRIPCLYNAGRSRWMAQMKIFS